ncbi:hypothetical protein BBP00_00006558 [Phytophthora kernoviae]|uniref:Glycosyl transferase family 1 domain-containing protein n=1 Tax=Phytophthora kernoviae TaxID=325452 RepID=A0A3F2RKT6_9STRA|nr:hypothetical protein BBP00_00006558 [Phytophthora kernoviae]
MAKKEFHKVYNAQARRSLAMPTQSQVLMGTMALAGLLLVLELAMLRGGRDVTSDYAHAEATEGQDFYPDEILSSDWAKDVEESDLVHLSLLHEACLSHKDSVVPWTYGLNGEVSTPSVLIEKDDPNLLDKMRQCPDVDIFLPVGIRGHGYCEDSIAYTKFLESRMLPAWAVEMKYVDNKTGETLSYHDLCPKTPMIFLNHYWDGIPDSPDWPKSKPLYLMPNIEMYELKAEHYWGVDVVLCKTAICARRVRLWTRLGDDSVKAKNWSDVQFIHAVGTSVQKGTKPVLNCWLGRPDFPPLHVYMHEDVYNGNLKAHYEDKIRDTQVHMHVGRASADEFGQMIAEAAFFMCTSLQEGYGHYINQARASGAVIVTTDLPPMNEFLTSRSGILIPVKRWAYQEQLLGGKYNGEHGLKGLEGFTADLEGDGVCAAVEKVLSMTPAQREDMAEMAKKQYFIDLNFFAAKMKELRGIARGEVSRLRGDID